MGGGRSTELGVCHHLPRLASLLALSALACGEPAPPPLQLSPLGHHLAHVGETLVLPLSSLAPNEHETLQWSLLRGPDEMGLLQDAKGARLVWVPNAFDLGPSKQGAPRMAGQPEIVVVSARALSGASGQSTGSVQAVPTSLPAEIDVSPTLWLQLSERRAGRWPVSTATTALGAMDVQLGPDAPEGAEILKIGEGRFTLRYRPTASLLATQDRVHFTLYAPDPHEAIAQRAITVRLLGHPANPACAGEAPALQVKVSPAATSGGSALRLRAQDDQPGPLRFRVMASEVSDTDAPLSVVSSGSLPYEGRAVTLPMPATGSLWAIVAEVRDRDDPLLSICDHVGRWPSWGRALMSRGPTCIDDPDQRETASTKDALPSLSLSTDPNSGLDRRLCPQREDRLTLLQPAGQPLALAARSPEGWPAHALRIFSGPSLLCTHQGKRSICHLPAPSAPRLLLLRIQSEQPSSVHLRAWPIDESCRASPQPESPPLLPSKTPPQTLNLCPGERHAFRVRLPSTGERWLRWRHERGRVAVEASTDGETVGRWRDQGGELLIRLSGPPGELQTITTRSLSLRPLTTTVDEVSPPSPVLAPTWLPSLQPWTLYLRPKGSALLGLAGNGEATTLGLAPGSALQPLLVQAADPQALPVLSQPWPAVGDTSELLPSAPPRVRTSSLSPGAAALRLKNLSPLGTVVSLLPVSPSSPACAPDRYGGDDEENTIALLVPAQGAIVLGELHLCAGQSRHFSVQVETDDLLEVALSCPQAPPPMTIVGPNGRQAPANGRPLKPSAWPHASSLPPHRHLATCWVERAGAAIIQLGPASTDARYDLALRRR